MKKLLILGAGMAGTMAANKLTRLFHERQLDWQITLVDPDALHYYQPGFLFVPFGVYGGDDIVLPKRRLLPSDVELLQACIVEIDHEHNRVQLSSGEKLDYDFLIIATGADIHPEQTPGLSGPAWGDTIHTFYSFQGAVALFEKLRVWKGGRLVVNVVENPIKCPVAPLEFLMLADAFFLAKGMRDKVQLTYATPLSGAFTKPVAASHLNTLLAIKGIQVEPDYLVEAVNPDMRTLSSFDGRELGYDVLVSVPINMGATVVGESGLGDDLNYVPVNQHTMLDERHPNIFVLGDAAALPTSKAGSVAHFAIEKFCANFLDHVNGRQMHESFDGHANCFIESGHGKGLLIDFNYVTEPLPGAYPVPWVGPFSLLKETRANHWGKMLFKWIYWNILLKGYRLPIPTDMSMTGKQTVEAMN